jgi:hypothetical protein
VLTALREALSATLAAMGDDWLRRFLATRGLAARSSAVRNHSDLTSLTVQRRLVEVLEKRLGIDSRQDVRLRLLGEVTLSAWRCGARNWVRSGKDEWHSGKTRGHRSVRQLVREVERAFDAIPDSLTLSTRS